MSGVLSVRRRMWTVPCTAVLLFAIGGAASASAASSDYVNGKQVPRAKHSCAYYKKRADFRSWEVPNSPLHGFRDASNYLLFVKHRYADRTTDSDSYDLYGCWHARGSQAAKVRPWHFPVVPMNSDGDPDEYLDGSAVIAGGDWTVFESSVDDDPVQSCSSVQVSGLNLKRGRIFPSTQVGVAPSPNSDFVPAGTPQFLGSRGDGFAVILRGRFHNPFSTVTPDDSRAGFGCDETPTRRLGPDWVDLTRVIYWRPSFGNKFATLGESAPTSAGVQLKSLKLNKQGLNWKVGTATQSIARSAVLLREPGAPPAS